MTEDKPVTSNNLRSPSRLWLVIVGVTGLVLRALTVLLYQPVAYSDTPSYRRLAEAVRGGFVNYDGTRTPGYPVFLALTGSDENAWLVQLLLGFITTLLMFYIGWKLTDKPWFGGLIALVHTLNLGQLFFESNLLTESLTTFLLVLTMAGVLFWLVNPNKRGVGLSFLLGLVSTISTLVRPLFIFLPFLLLIFLYLTSRIKSPSIVSIHDGSSKDEANPKYSKRYHWRIGIAFILPVILLLGGWISFIHAQFGDWSLTTMTGYHLIQHTGSFFEYVPDEYASIRDIYIQYRDEHIAQFGTQTNSIWDAIPEMSRISGYSFYELSRVLARVSINLILKHPVLFIKSAINGWWMFWRTSVYWSAEALRVSWLAGGVELTIQIQRAMLFLTNLVFIFGSLYYALNAFITAVRHKPAQVGIHFAIPAQQAFFWLLLGTIWVTSILQTLLDHGDNPRFLVPLQSLLVLWVAVFIFQLAHRRPVGSNPASLPE